MMNNEKTSYSCSSSDNVIIIKHGFERCGYDNGTFALVTLIVILGGKAVEIIISYLNSRLTKVIKNTLKSLLR